ncbi:reverse transcriptase domain-containing protein [Tanacetum coccineum]
MQTRSAGQDPTTPYSEPEHFIHQTLRKKKKRNPFIPIDDRVPNARYPPFENLFEAKVVYNPFLDLPFPMADNQPMWGNNRAVARTPRAAIVVVDLGDNFTVKRHHLSMIKDRQFDGRSQTDPHKHITEFVKVFGMFRYGSTNADAIKLKLFPSSLAGESKIWFNELNPSVITTWEEMKHAFDHQSHYRDENRNSNPSKENPPILRLPKKKPDESEFEKTMREFIIAQKATNDFVKNQFYNLKTKVEQGQKNHQAAIQDLETKFGRIFDHQSLRPTGILPSNTQTNPKPSTSNNKPYRPPTTQSEHVNAEFTRSGKTYDPPVNPNAKPAVFLDDSKDEADEVEKEEVRINVPLVDVLAGMPNYGKFLKDLVSNKSKMEQISAAFLTKEYSAILQNKLLPKLGDPEIFLIPCKLANLVEYLALADLGASINLMPYSLYATLSGTTLKPMRMRINPSFYKHNINFEDDVKPVIQRQRRLTPNMKEVVKKEIIKLLDAGIIYAIEDRWRVCIDYRKLNEATRKDHFVSTLHGSNARKISMKQVRCFSTDFLDTFKFPSNQPIRKRPLSLALMEPTPTSDEPYLFKACPDGMIRRCVHSSETQKILDECHHGPTGGHYGPSITVNKVFDAGFYWPTIFKEAKTLSKTGRLPTFGPFPKSHNFEYILVAIDYVSKWAEAKALPINDARVIVNFLKKLFSHFGTPKAFISDRGTHFCNRQMEKILKIKDNPSIWSRKLDDAQWAFPTAYKTPIGITLYRLLYGKTCHLSFEIEHRAYWALRSCNPDLKLAREKQFLKLNELDELRLQAYENSKLYKARTKAYHDKKLRVRKEFKAGDKVLLYNSKYKFSKLQTQNQSGVDRS